jgi:hypothetical protein
MLCLLAFVSIFLIPFFSFSFIWERQTRGDNDGLKRSEKYLKSHNLEASLKEMEEIAPYFKSESWEWIFEARNRLVLSKVSNLLFVYSIPPSKPKLIQHQLSALPESKQNKQ